MPNKSIPIDNSILCEWSNDFADSSQAEFCVRYALTFNTLNVNWLAGAMASDVTFGSQSVCETLEGKSNVWEYIAGKINTLCTYKDSRPRGELGVNSAGEPCVLMYQPKGAYDCNWLDEPLAKVEFKTNSTGQAAEIFMVTIAPTAKRCGIYPGIENDVCEQAKRFIRPGDNYDGLRFSYFLLDGTIPLDCKMMEESEKLQVLFPGSSRSILLTTERTTKTDELDEVGFIGFPSVAVYWGDEIIFRQQGFIAADCLSEEIKKITGMYLVQG